MEKIGLALLVLIAVVAFIGLVNLDTSTGQVYYTSYQYKTQIVTGNMVNAPPGGFILGVADGVVVGRGELANGQYQMTVSGSWRDHLGIDVFVNGQAYCATIPVARLLDPSQILYDGRIALSIECV